MMSQYDQNEPTDSCFFAQGTYIHFCNVTFRIKTKYLPYQTKYKLAPLFLFSHTNKSLLPSQCLSHCITITLLLIYFLPQILSSTQVGSGSLSYSQCLTNSKSNPQICAYIMNKVGTNISCSIEGQVSISCISSVDIFTITSE